MESPMPVELPCPDHDAPAHLTAQDLGLLLSQRREIVSTQCRLPSCGKAITGTKRRRYCSDSHRVKHARLRLRDLGPYDQLAYLS